MARIVTTSYRYKRPPRKRKAVALDAGTAIVTTTSRKQSRLLSAERAPEADAAEVSPEVKAFFARMVRPGGALPPKR